MTQFINTQRGSKGEKGDPGKSGASLKSVEFVGNDMVFTDTDDHSVTLEDAKITLTGPQGEPGEDGNDGAAATISVGTTTTGNPGTNASVTNSGTSSAAVFNFTIPRGADGIPGQDGEAATITAGTATGLPAGSSPTVTNSGSSSAAVFNFGIPAGEKGATGNGIASVTSSKTGKVTTVTITETDGDSSSFTVSDGEDGEGSGDVIGPSSAVNGHLAVFDGTSGKLIKDGGAIPTPTTVVDNLTTQSATSALSANQGYVLDGKISTINGKIPSEATSSNKLADKQFVNDAINSVTAYYITKNAQGDQFATYAELAAATTFYSGGVVRVPTRNDYTIVLDDETHNDEVTRYIYNNGWEYQYTINESPLTQAQLDALNSGITSGKVSSYDSAVTTIGGYGDIVTHDASEFATSAQGGKADTALQPNDNITELNNNAGYITSSSLPGKASSSTLGTVKLGSDTVQSVSANAVSGTASRTYATQLNSSDQLVVNVPRTDTTYESKTAASGGTDVSLVTTGEKYTWNNKQNAISDLATIRAGAGKGATAVQPGDNISTLNNNIGYIKSGDFQQELNAFNGTPKAFYSSLHNALYRADRTASVTLTNASGGSSNLFNNNYESYIQITHNSIGKILIEKDGTGLLGGYSTGYLYLSFYSSREPRALNKISARGYTDYQNRGWADFGEPILIQQGVVGPSVVKLSSPHPYRLQKIEINLTEDSDNDLWLTQVEFQPSRGNGIQNLSVVTKYGNSDIYGTISADAIKKIGGTSSQFLKADGSVDSNTYITSAYHDSSKQDTLVSGTNIKTINNTSLLGSGNIDIQKIIRIDQKTATLTDIQNIHNIVREVGPENVIIKFTDTNLTQTSGDDPYYGSLRYQGFMGDDREDTGGYGYVTFSSTIFNANGDGLVVVGLQYQIDPRGTPETTTTVGSFKWICKQITLT